MSLAFRRIQVYSKLTLIVLVLIAIGAVLWKNSNNQVTIWFFWLTDEQASFNVIWLILCSAVGALISYWILSMVWGLWRDMRRIAQESTLTEKQKEQEARERELQEREERVDAKLKKAISEEE